MVMYNDIKEMKQDVKILLASSVEDRVKIDYLEKEVQLLRSKLDRVVNSEYPYKDVEDEYPPIYAVIPKGQSSTNLYIAYNEL